MRNNFQILLRMLSPGDDAELLIKIKRETKKQPPI
jgi:hypothetical protein